MKLSFPPVALLLDEGFIAPSTDNTDSKRIEIIADYWYKYIYRMARIQEKGEVMIGPYNLSQIVLCSADANPRSQRSEPGNAETFFPGAKWVGAVRNASTALGCRFVILTTAHGLVDPHDTIAPYDMHINEYRREVTATWKDTIPARLHGGGYQLVVFYAGGCPRDEMLDVMLPILRNLRIDLLTFGKPNMFDAGKIRNVVEAVIQGTTSDELRNMLKVPHRFVFWRNRN